jgi:hypothetical protein
VQVVDATLLSTITFDVSLVTLPGESFDFSNWRIDMFYDTAELSNPTAIADQPVFIGPYDPDATPPMPEDILDNELRSVYLDFNLVPFAPDTSTVLVSATFDIVNPVVQWDGLSDFWLNSPVAFADFDGPTEIDVQSNGADVGSPVPIPGAFLLLGSGLLAWLACAGKLS